MDTPTLVLPRPAVTLIVRRLLFVALAVALAPGLAYESVQKTSEHLGLRGHWPRLSSVAEQYTRWAPKTGIGVLDHALHEIDETRRFWSLVRDPFPIELAQDLPSRGSALGNSSSSAR